MGSPSSAVELNALRSRWLTPMTSLRALYDVQAKLGGGAFGNVFRGTQRSTGRRVAIKVLDQKALDIRNIVLARQIFNEIEVLDRVKGIDNPCLLKFVAAHEDISPATGLPRLIVVTDVCDGGQLYETVKIAGRYTERDAADLVARLARALHQLHEHGIVHRDLKPENILYSGVGADAVPVLIDFGLSKLVDRPDAFAGVVGTPSYIAPEMLRERRTTFAGDVFTLGVLTYILLCGAPPFHAEGGPRDVPKKDVITQRTLEGRYAPMWGDVSDEARALVGRMLAVDDRARITLPELLAHPWIATNAHGDRVLGAAVERLKAFNTRRRIRAAAYAVMMGANGLAVSRAQIAAALGGVALSAAQLGGLVDAFAALAGPHGTVSRPQFDAMLRPVPGLDEPRLAALFRLFDADGSGDVDCHELLLGLVRCRSRDEAALRACFRVLDGDGDGKLSLSELVQLVLLWRAPDEPAVPVVEAPPGRQVVWEGAGGAAAVPAAAAAAATAAVDEAASMEDDVTFTALELMFEMVALDFGGRVSFDEFTSCVVTGKCATFLASPHVAGQVPSFYVSMVSCFSSTARPHAEAAGTAAAPAPAAGEVADASTLSATASITHGVSL